MWDVPGTYQQDVSLIQQANSGGMQSCFKSSSFLVSMRGALETHILEVAIRLFQASKAD
jgi:hypothetical protein